MLILGNVGVVFALILGKILQLLFFGQLYTLETERIYESACHFRLCSAIAFLGLADVYLIRYWVMAFQYSSNSDRNSVTVPTFAFECLLLLNSILTTTGKYFLNVVEAYYLKNHEDEDIWESKTYWSFILEVISLFTRLSAYCTLFFLILLPYRLLPLHIIRDTYITAKSLISTVQKHIKARRAKRQIENVVRTVTQEELSNADDVCIICREDMILEEGQHSRTIPKKLLCGHIIHFGCLKGWLERSLRCPTCRRSVMDGTFPDQPGAANNNAANGNNEINQNNGIGFNANFGGQNNEIPGLNNPANPQHLNHIHPTPTLNLNQHTFSTSATASPSNSENLAFVSTQVFNFPHQAEIPEGFQMPYGWNVLAARETPDGELQVQVTSDYWATVMPSDLPHTTNDNIDLAKHTEILNQESSQNKTDINTSSAFSVPDQSKKGKEKPSFDDNIQPDSHEEKPNETIPDTSLSSPELKPVNTSMETSNL
ncbi:uncharacterized protein SAPINGB_P003888 [Magnusiomyces paraingens]|uniref:RING-type E3 ubiquitin transferase n=1 Tax=Magnusiomyces paraingens TaxID=2606893 RepID=A0A5E8BRS6_9ASCO|nr:uncharacterized protein SAPINGB_P003888 [Saprochaete ingens]VVT54063.1 unnamed protein product [Saprochaete ingens]